MTKKEYFNLITTINTNQTTTKSELQLKTCNLEPIQSSKASFHSKIIDQAPFIQVKESKSNKGGSKDPINETTNQSKGPILHINQIRPFKDANFDQLSEAIDRSKAFSIDLKREGGAGGVKDGENGEEADCGVAARGCGVEQGGSFRRRLQASS